jgi:hypothetical protein
VTTNSFEGARDEDFHGGENLKHKGADIGTDLCATQSETIIDPDRLVPARRREAHGEEPNCDADALQRFRDWLTWALRWSDGPVTQAGRVKAGDAR